MRFGLLKVVFTVIVFSASAFAGPVNWTLVGVTFGDGGTASGSFVYDATLNQYTSINVTTTTGSVRTGANYQFFSNGFPPSGAGVLLVTSNAANLTGTPGFAMFFSPALTNAGGNRALTGQEASCGNAGCTFPSDGMRFVTAGSVTAAVPEPSSVVLLGLGVAILGAVRARRRSHQYHL